MKEVELYVGNLNQYPFVCSGVIGCGGHGSVVWVGPSNA